MLLRSGTRNPNRVIQLGLLALVLANLASYLVQRKSELSESVTDPIVGFAYGVAIATTLLGVHLRARSLRGVKS